MTIIKEHVSYSEIKVWKECGWRHKLVYVDKLIKDLGPIADMLRPSKEHSTFSQDVRIKEDLDRINQIMKQII